MAEHAYRVKRHVICERDVGLFSLIQQVVSNIPWALHEGRVPIVYFQDKTCYWTPNGYRDADTVWEYYFEPLVADHPASSIPDLVRAAIATQHPSPYEVGYFADEDTFVSNHFGDHPQLQGLSIAIPYLWEDPSDELRRKTHTIMQQYVRPRDYINRKVEQFAERHFSDHFIVGVHVRGTDATSEAEIRPHRQGSLNLAAYLSTVQRQLDANPTAQVFVATDDERSFRAVRDAFGSRVLAYDSIRHKAGEPAGAGPTGWIMPAYIAADRDRAATNGEEAIIEYLLLSRSHYLVHNGSSLARTVLLKRPDLVHSNTHQRTSAIPSAR